MSAAQHRSIQQAIATTLGLPAWSGSTASPPAVAIDFDAASVHAGTNDATWLATFDPTGKKNGYIEDSGGAMIVRGGGSLCLTRKGNGLHAFRYQTVPGQTGDICVATAGNADRYAEVIRSVAGVVSVKVTDGATVTTTVIGKAGAAKQVVRIRTGASLTIEHSSCRVFNLGSAFAEKAFIGRAYHPDYLAPKTPSRSRTALRASNDSHYLPFGACR